MNKDMKFELWKPGVDVASHERSNSRAFLGPSRDARGVSAVTTGSPPTRGSLGLSIDSVKARLLSCYLSNVEELKTSAVFPREGPGAVRSILQTSDRELDKGAGAGTGIGRSTDWTGAGPETGPEAGTGWGLD